MEIQLLSKTYSVRRLTLRDVDIIYALMIKNEIFYRYHPPMVTKESIREDLEALPPKKDRKDKYFLGFFEKDTLIALMDLILSYPAERTAFIGLFMTDVRYQHRGLGSGLIGEICDCLRKLGFEKIRLGVDHGNPQSFAFWSKNHFSVVDEKEYIVMERTLPSPPEIFVETERLILRKAGKQDEAYFRNYLLDKEMDRMMLRSPCTREEDVQLGLDWFLHKEERAYVILHKETGETIGNLTVYNCVPESVAVQDSLRGQKGKSLSFAISAPWRRKGLMYEALRGVISHLLGREGADYIHCGYLSYNAPSKALQEKLGFVPLFTEEFQLDGREIQAVECILRDTGPFPGEGLH